MKNKILSLTVLFSLALTGCAAASAADDHPAGGHSEVDVDLADGYYTNDKDNSYIHITDGKIELCGYDIESEIRKEYDSITDDKVSFEEYLANSEELFEEKTKLQSFTPVCFNKMGENGEDMTLLVVNYDFAKDNGTYTGYTLNPDGTIKILDNTYSFSSTELTD
mgnify:CR=1 FL=1